MIYVLLSFRGKIPSIDTYTFFFIGQTMPRINCVSYQLEEKSFSPQFKLISQKCGWINTLAEVCTLIMNFRPLKLPVLESASELTQHALS